MLRNRRRRLPSSTLLHVCQRSHGCFWGGGAFGGGGPKKKNRKWGGGLRFQPRKNTEGAKGEEGKKKQRKEKETINCFTDVWRCLLSTLVLPSNGFEEISTTIDIITSMHMVIAQVPGLSAQPPRGRLVQSDSLIEKR